MLVGSPRPQHPNLSASLGPPRPELVPTERALLLARDYQVGGVSLDSLARRYRMPRSQVERALKQQGVPRRGASEAHKARHARLSADERRAQTARAREAARAPRTARGRQAQAVISWCNQALSNPHKATAREFRQHGVHVQAQYPAGPHNIYLAVPNALLAIEVMPRRHTHANGQAFLTKVSYLLERGWFVTFLSRDVQVHFCNIVGMAKVRSGLCLDRWRRDQMRLAMQPFFEQLQAGHQAAIAMAESLFLTKEERLRIKEEGTPLS